MNPRHGTAAVLAAIVALGAGGTGAGEGTGRKVRVIRPERRDHVRVLRYPGSALPYQQAMLNGRVEGYLAEVSVFEGDVVERGAVLARIAAPELLAEREAAAAALGTATAQVDKAAAAIEIAAATLQEKEAAVEVRRADYELKAAIAERRRKLVESRAVTPEELQEAEAEAAVARARADAAVAAVTLARAGVKDARAMADVAAEKVKAAEAELARAGALVGFTEIRSPYASAVVARRHLDPGALVRAGGEPIVTVMDVSRIRVLVHVPERDALRVEVGQAVELRVDADPDHPIACSVTRLARALDLDTRTMRAEIEVPGSAGLLAGMYCDVRITVEEREGVLFLPASAVLSDAAGARAVFVVEDGRARRVPIETGYEDGLAVEIVSGIAADARVIDGKPKLEDNEPVTPNE